jgi:hypothetical protein
VSENPVYQVFVDDNFHYMDDEYRYALGKYDTAEAAIAVCKRIVDDFLVQNYKPGMTAERLWDQYKAFGEDPFVLAEGAEHPKFSSWDYARERCKEICRRRSRGMIVRN